MPDPVLHSQPQWPIVLRDLFLPRPDLQSKLADLPWKSFRPGVDVVELYGSVDGGPWAALLRYSAGAGIPMHTHHSHEHIIVLCETQADETGSYPAGTVVIHPPQSRHTVANQNGGIVLVIRHAPVEFKT